MLRVGARLIKRLTIPRILLFTNDKPPKPTAPEPGKIEITKEELNRIMNLVKNMQAQGLTDSKPSDEPVFKTKEQILSFKLLQAKNSADVLAILKQVDDKTSLAELFIVVYSYAKFSSPLDKEILPTFYRVLQHLDSLDGPSLVKVYELLFQYRKEWQTLNRPLPQLPKPKQMPGSDLLQLTYWLCRLYPNNPDLDAWIQLISPSAAQQNPLILSQIIEMLEKPTNHLNTLLEKSIEECDDSSQVARLIIHNLQSRKGKLAVQLCEKLDVSDLEVDLFVNLLYQLIEVQQLSQEDTNKLNDIKNKMLQRLPNLQLGSCTIETYLALWTVATKSKDPKLIQKLTDLSSFQNVQLSQINTSDLFTVFISASFLKIAPSPFLSDLCSHLITKIPQLSPDQLFYCFMASRRLGTPSGQFLEASTSKLPKMSPKCREAFQKIRDELSSGH